MPSLSLAGGVDARYEVAAGRTTVIITSRSPLNHRAVYVGTGQLLFHWVQEGKTQVWRCDSSMLDPAAVQAVEREGEDGSQMLEVELPELYPAGLLLQGRIVGTLMAPAVHVDIPMGTDVWVFLVRSPWFPLRLRLGRASLALRHDEGSVMASLGAQADGSLAAEVSLNGKGFKSASLSVRRTLGSYKSDELVCEVQAGSQTALWKPVSRAFDLVLVTKGSISESEFVDVAKGLGAEVTSVVFGIGGVQGDFILCDGPALSYDWVLRGHKGFLQNDEDSTDAKYTW